MSPDQGVIYVLLDHFVRHLYPRALDMERRLLDGAKLSARDLDHVRQQLDDLRLLAPLIERHPEHRDTAARVMGLYLGIARRACLNESAARAAPKET